jgi:argininosuccinate lyase
LKEFKYQAEKTISKVDEKYKKELTELQGQYA